VRAIASLGRRADAPLPCLALADGRVAGLADDSLSEKVHRRAGSLPGPPVASHPAEREITARDLAWARHIGIVGDERASRKHAAIRCGSFAAHTYARAPVEVAMLGANLITWLYLFDDRFGEGEQGESQAELRTCFAAFEQVARTGLLPRDPNAFHRALLELVERGEALGGAAWRGRFADSLAFYMEGCAQELPFRRSGRVPDMDQYRRIKLGSVGAFPVFDLVELAHGDPRTREQADGEWIAEARRIAAWLCAWVNDLYSFPKEARDGDPLNVVAVLMHEHTLSVDAALDRVIELYGRDIARLHALFARARVHGVSAATDAVLQGIERWVHGNRVWTGSCGRYQR
jgi:hypothetical protein